MLRPRKPFVKQFRAALDAILLDQQDRVIIDERFVDIIRTAEIDYYRSSMLFLSLTNLITIGGVLIVSLLSFGAATDSIGLSSTAASAMYWISWVLSVLVTIANKIIYSFNVPKNYMLNFMVLEKFKSEGWQFVEGIGRYENLEGRERAKMFFSRIEHIKVKSLEMYAGGTKNAPKQDGEITPVKHQQSMILTDILATSPSKVHSDHKPQSISTSEHM